MIKKNWVLALFVAAVLVFAGCSNDGNKNNNNENNVNNNEVNENVDVNENNDNVEEDAAENEDNEENTNNEDNVENEEVVEEEEEEFVSDIELFEFEVEDMAFGVPAGFEFQDIGLPGHGLFILDGSDNLINLIVDIKDMETYMESASITEVFTDPSDLSKYLIDNNTDIYSLVSGGDFVNDGVKWAYRLVEFIDRPGYSYSAEAIVDGVLYHVAYIFPHEPTDEDRELFFAVLDSTVIN